MGIQFSGELKIVPNIHNGLGNYYLYQEYSPAIVPGAIIFPDHIYSVGSLNPNEIGQTGGSTATQIYINVLDSISTDNTTKTFNLTSNFSAVTVDSPHALLITLGNMILTPYVINTYEQYIFPQEMDVVPSGNYTVSSNVITFADAPLTTQRFYGRLLGTYINTTDTVTRNVFRAVPVVLS